MSRFKSATPIYLIGFLLLFLAIIDLIDRHKTRLFPEQRSQTIANGHGGWQYNNESIITNYHFAFDDGFGKALANFLNNKNIVDIGAGVGQLGYFLKIHNSNVKWTGYDGGSDVEELYGKHIPISGEPDFVVPELHWMDAAVPITALAVFTKYDWVVSIEVGEHIPKQFESIFLDNLVKLAKEGVVLSWAVKGVEYEGYQCHLHVNEQPNSYIIEQMEGRGFKYDVMLSSEFRKSVSTLPWLRNTIMVFRKL